MKSKKKRLSIVVSSLVLFSSFIPSVFATYQSGIPEAVDPGTPPFTGLENPVPTEPVPYDPSKSMLGEIYKTDKAAGGDSYWMDRILERPGSVGGNDLFTRGRALYMYTHSPNVLGFGGGYAYREMPTGTAQNLYAVTISGTTLSEDTSKRKQYPSYWSSEHTAAGLRIKEKKFITYNNVAVTILDVTNTGNISITKTLSVSSPIVSTPSEDGTELTGIQKARYDLTTMYPRLSGDGMKVDGTKLTKSITLDPGKSTTVKLQMGVITKEIPDSKDEYERYAGYDPQEAYLKQLDEYNKWWSENVPYIDIPDQNIKKMSYYRTFLNRFNYLDANIPGNDFQFPVSIEGVLGYNNAIQLTQPMHMQDLKYFRNPIYSYGDWLSSGESSKYSAFQDNPGDPAHWNNTYEQWISDEAWESYKVHGGDKKILNNLARYAEGDVEGQLAKYDTNNNSLVQYDWGSLTGNDADAVAMNWKNQDQERTDQSSFNYSAALSAAEAYKNLGNEAKAQEMTTLAEKIKKAILDNLWDDSDGANGKVFKQKDIASGELVPWKDQQNFSPFTQEVVPNTDNYKQALRFYADKDQFPIMPFFTANQADKKEAVAAGKGGSNNFSNINSTLQARLYATAIRKYPSEYIKPDMYKRLIEWLTWTQYVNGDNRYPDNNEFWNSYDPATKKLNYRSWIHHNILGAYNFSIIEDIAGMQPRADDTLELWPIDMGYDYFTVNNLSYHGSDLTIVWDKPDGKHHYGENVPEGYSVYLDGQRVFTVDDLVHLTYDSKSGEVTIKDENNKAKVTFHEAKGLKNATEVSLADNARAVDMFQKAGVDITKETGDTVNLAKGKKVSASYTAVGTKPEEVTKPENAVDGFTVSGVPTTRGTHYAAPNPIWGAKGSPNKQDWFEVDFGSPTAFDNVKLYFYSDKNKNNYKEPLYYSIQYLDGSEWKTVPKQKKSTIQANFNEVKFNSITAQKMRVLMTPNPGFAIGLKEVQVFHTGIAIPDEPNKAPLVNVLVDDSFKQVMKKRLVASVSDDGQNLDFPELTWSKKSGPGSVVFSDPTSVSTVASFTEEGKYVVTLKADDGALSTSADLEINVTKESVNLAMSAKPSTSFVSSWEDLNAINNGIEPKSSTDKTGGAYGNWNHNSNTEWVQYTWDHEIVTNESDVYWWTDNGGILMPTASKLQYLDTDGTTWKDVEDVSGLRVEANKYNKTTFKTVKTKALRMTITRGSQWTGILEWKVLEPSVLKLNPDNVKVRALSGEKPNLPKTIQRVFDGITQDVNVIWDEISPDQLNEKDTEIHIWGALDSSYQMVPATIYVRSEKNVTINTITDENITTVVGAAPELPQVVEVQYNDGSMDNIHTKVTWDSIGPAKYADMGEFTVKGTVEGTDIKAIAKVKVKPTVEYFNSLLEKAHGISNEFLIYTKDSYQALQDAIKDAETAGEIETENQLNSAIAPLKAAMDGLVKISINHDNLADLTKKFLSETGAAGSSGITNSLVTKLVNAKKASDRGDTAEADDSIQSYIDEVSAQSGKKITKEQAKILIWWAEHLLSKE